jgi:hypothetical protein
MGRKEEVELVEIKLFPIRVEKGGDVGGGVRKKVKKGCRLRCYQMMRDYIIQLKMLVFLMIILIYIVLIYEKCRVSNQYVIDIYTKHVSNITNERTFKIGPALYSNLSSLVFVDTVECATDALDDDGVPRSVYYRGEFQVRENGIILQGKGTIILKHHHIVEKTINIVCDEGKLIQFEYIELIQIYLLITSLFMVIISMLGMIGFWTCGKTCFSKERETVRISNIYAVMCLMFVIATAYFVISSSKDKE